MNEGLRTHRTNDVADKGGEGDISCGVGWSGIDKDKGECSEERLCKDDFGSLGRMDRMR